MIFFSFLGVVICFAQFFKLRVFPECPALQGDVPRYSVVSKGCSRGVLKCSKSVPGPFLDLKLLETNITRCLICMFCNFLNNEISYSRSQLPCRFARWRNVAFTFKFRGKRGGITKKFGSNHFWDGKLPSFAKGSKQPNLHSTVTSSPNCLQRFFTVHEVLSYEFSIAQKQISCLC